VKTTAENAEVPHLKMLKVNAGKTFSASPPDLGKPLRSDGLPGLAGPLSWQKRIFISPQGKI
jgi:hypothetical protein